MDGPERENDLDVDTAVTAEPSRPGRYVIDLPDRWNFVVPQGGVVMAAALRAQAAELGQPELRPVSVTGMFCSPVPAGRLGIDVTMLRRGRAAAQMRAEVTAESVGELGIEMIATMALDRTGPEVTDCQFPDMPMPDQAELVTIEEEHNPHSRWPFFRGFEVRMAYGAKWWTKDWEAGRARHARWFRYRRPPRDSAGNLERYAIPALTDVMPAALLNYLGPHGERFRAPSLDLTVYFLEDSPCDWFLVSSYARRARAGYATAEVEVWSEDKRLIAIGTQMMMLRRY